MVNTHMQFGLAVAAGALALTTLGCGLIQLCDPTPLSPWEPALAMEGTRLRLGLPLYENAHATHMYGPLLTGLYAVVFRMAGHPSFIAARVCMCIFGLALVVTLTAIVCHRKQLAYWCIAFGLFFGLNLRTNLVGFSMQPDVAAAAGGTIALVLWARRSGSASSVAALLLFAAAFLVKQTAAAFTLIPIVQELVWSRPVRPHRVIAACTPLAVILVVLVLLRLLLPEVFTAMVTVPAAIRVRPELFWPVLVLLLVSFPIFLLSAALRVHSSEPLNELERWIVSALGVLVPLTVWIMCKSGSDSNSLLFTLLAMTAFVALQIDRLTALVSRLPNASEMAAAAAVIVLVFVSFFCRYERTMALLQARCGDDKYDTAVTISAGAAPGEVISPQDPTIAYRASGFLGHSLFLELDKFADHGEWPAVLPPPVQAELATARAVIQVRSYVPTPVFDRGLKANNFRPVQVAALNHSAYTLWAKQ